MAFIVPIMMAMGASATTATAVATVATYAGAAATIIGGMNQAEQMKSAARTNARNQEVAAQSNKSQLDAQAIQEEAVGQRASEQKRHETDLKLSRAYAVNASQGGGDLNDAMINQIVGRGEMAAGYETYTAQEKATGLRFRGDQGLAGVISQGQADISAADTKANATILGSAVKGASMASSFSPGPAPTAPTASGASLAADNDMNYSSPHQLYD